MVARLFKVALVGLLVLAPCARAVTLTQTYKSTGDYDVFTVPAGVTSLGVRMVGGWGGGQLGFDHKFYSGGRPATVHATITVVPGQRLFVYVAGNGTRNDPGFNGGGDAADSPDADNGGGGSDVRTCQQLSCRLVVAGGGGGIGALGCSVPPAGLSLRYPYGGWGGSADLPGYPGSFGPFLYSAGGGGGGPGTLSAPGATGSSSRAPDLPAALGYGGEGAPGKNACGDTNRGGGGGGGGGIYGGGGGGSGTCVTAVSVVACGAGGGGGGGSSGVPAGAKGVSDFALVQTAPRAEPHITFTWSPPARAAPLPRRSPNR